MTAPSGENPDGAFPFTGIRHEGRSFHMGMRIIHYGVKNPFVRSRGPSFFFCSDSLLWKQP